MKWSKGLKIVVTEGGKEGGGRGKKLDYSKALMAAIVAGGIIYAIVNYTRRSTGGE